MLTIDSAYKFIAKDYKGTLMFCLLAAIAVFIPLVGALLLMGLSIRIISNSINQNDEIPKVFGNFGNDVMNGLKYMAFGFILMIPFMAIFAGSFSGIISASMSNDISEMTNIALSMGFLWILVAVLIFAYILIIPALTANYAKEQKFSAFFDINKAFSIVFGNFGAYLKMIGINILYSIVIGFISGILSFTVIAPLLASPLMILVNGKIMGEWYSEASKK
ncbi:MAG: DUF4013 domain-containing protein [Candidatus Nanoarchaeia archaeon]|jgi:hypothetical protein